MYKETGISYFTLHLCMPPLFSLHNYSQCDLHLLYRTQGAQVKGSMEISRRFTYLVDR
jgi:hypothetical protein